VRGSVVIRTPMLPASIAEHTSRERERERERERMIG
jgi:hypothetical protein